MTSSSLYYFYCEKMPELKLLNLYNWIYSKVDPYLHLFYSFRHWLYAGTDYSLCDTEFHIPGNELEMLQFLAVLSDGTRQGF